MTDDMRVAKPLFWIGSSRKDVQSFPVEVKKTVGFALWLAQLEGRHLDAKPLQGFGGAGVLEVVEDYQGDTYRAVYTVRLASAVYVLHAFQKKSTRGRKTPQHEIELIRQRLKRAEEEHARWTKQLDEAKKNSRDYS